MKPTSTLIVCLLAGAAILGLPGKGSAETVDSAALESSIRRDLNEVISKIVDPGQFHVGVLSDVETNPERVIVEGESRSRIPAPQAKKKSPPPNMPGFDVDEEEEDTSSARDTNDDSWERQTFKTVDRNRIKAVLVHVSLDSGLSPALKEQVTRLIEDYTTLLPNKTRLKISFAPFKSNSIDPSVVPASRSLDQMNQNLKTVLAAIAGLFLAVLLLFALFGWILPARKERQLARRTAAERESAQAALTTLPARGIRSEPQASAIEVEERKAVLLSRFINDGYWFAKFHRSLDENGMQKLHQLVGGPAFSNLVSRFGLEAPESNGGEELSLTEKSEALARFSTDFSEFINLEKWNEHQFFGFLPNMSADSIVTLIRSIPKLDAAVMIKTLDAGRCAEVLGLMEEPELEVVLSMLPETSRLDTKALDEIEQRTRTLALKLPRTVGHLALGEEAFLETLVKSSDDQGKLLNTIRTTRPGMFDRLKRFQFSLDDVQKLPPQDLNRLLNRLDNSQIAKAMALLGSDARQHLLQGLSVERRALIENEQVERDSLSNADVKAIREMLLKPLREMAV